MLVSCVGDLLKESLHPILQMIMAPVIVEKEDPQSIEPLSKREVQVIALLADGLSKQKISEELSIKEPTVATHVRNIYHKMGVKNAAGAISKAYRCGILYLV